MSLVDIRIDKAETVLKIKLLFELLYIKYDIFFRTFNFNLLGLTVLRTKLSGSWRILYFLFLPIWFENVNKKRLNYFLDSVIEKYPQYNDYYIFLSRSGEFFLLMHHLKEWLAKNNSNNFILIFTARYHLNICKMFFPDIPMAYVKKANVPLISRGVKSIHSVYKTKNIYVPSPELNEIIDENYKKDLEVLSNSQIYKFIENCDYAYSNGIPYELASATYSIDDKYVGIQIIAPDNKEQNMYIYDLIFFIVEKLIQVSRDAYKAILMNKK